MFLLIEEDRGLFAYQIPSASRSVDAVIQNGFVARKVKLVLEVYEEDLPYFLK